VERTRRLNGNLVQAPSTRSETINDSGGAMKHKAEWILIILYLISIPAMIYAQDMTVGTLFDHTGALKDWGPRHQNAADLAARQISDAGFSMELIHKDSETAAGPARKAALELIEKYGVAGILGSSSSGVIVPVAEEITSPREMLMITPGATSPFITGLPQDEGRDFLFRTCPSDSLQGAVLGKMAAGLYRTASVMYVNNPYGQGLANQFRKTFQQNGGIVFTMIPHGEEVAVSYKDDLRKAFTRVFATKPYISGKSDVLCVFSYPEHAKVYVKEAIEFYDCEHFLFCDGSKSEELAQAVGPANVEGMFGTAPGVAVGEAYFKFTADYEAAYGKFPVSPFISNTYDATAVIGLAAYAASIKGLPVNAKNVRDHLRQVANPPGTFVGPGEFDLAFRLMKAGKNINYEGASGTVDFDEHGDVKAPIEVWRFSNGKIQTYRVEYQATE
jgi:ABC-type branched-subunit amino acid transport system substrate-binding protein